MGGEETREGIRDERGRRERRRGEERTGEGRRSEEKRGKEREKTGGEEREGQEKSLERTIPTAWPATTAAGGGALQQRLGRRCWQRQRKR